MCKKYEYYYFTMFLGNFNDSTLHVARTVSIDSSGQLAHHVFICGGVMRVCVCVCLVHLPVHVDAKD